MNFSEIKELDEQYSMNVFSRFPVAFVSGHGATLTDTEGKEYVDFLGGIAVNSLGYNDRELTRALKNQAGKVIHTCNYFYSEERSAFLKKLLEGSPFAKAFLSNSGAEANECALKLARKFFYNRKADRYEVLTAFHSFHGRTVATATLTGQEKYSRPYAPLLPGIGYISYNDIRDLKRKANAHTAAVMLELVQGESGVVPAKREYVRKVADFCKEKGLLLIVDEVQTGMGRTGTMFAFEQYGIQPDIVTLAKGIAGGVPMGATLCTAELAEAFAPGDHGSTFGGNPLACAAAEVVVSRLKDTNLLERVQRASRCLINRLKLVKRRTGGAIVDVRGLGLLVGAQLAPELNAREIVEEMLARGFILNAAGNNTLRFAPPLVIKRAEILAMCDALTEVLSEYSLSK